MSNESFIEQNTFQRSPWARTYFGRDGDNYVFGEAVDVSLNLDRVQRMRQAEINNATLGRCLYSLPLPVIAQFAQKLGVDIDVVANDDALLDQCARENGAFKVHKGWESAA